MFVVIGILSIVLFFYLITMQNEYSWISIYGVVIAAISALFVRYTEQKKKKYSIEDLKIISNSLKWRFPISVLFVINFFFAYQYFDTIYIVLYGIVCLYLASSFAFDYILIKQKSK